MPLKGDLSEFGVEHVLRLLAHAGRTGTLDIRMDAGRITIHITDGSVAGARGTDDPEVTVGRALLAGSGTFTFAAGPPAARTLNAPLDELLERAREKAREVIEVERSVPDEAARFKLSDRATAGSAFTVGPDELKVLMEVGGGRSAREVRQRAKLPRARVAALLHGLVQKGLIERASHEVALDVQAVRPPSAARRPRRTRPDAEVPVAIQPIEIAAAPAGTPADAADLSSADLASELDARLAALALAAPAPVPPESPDKGSAVTAEEDLIVVTPSVAAAPAADHTASRPAATVVFALHYMPASAEPASPGPPAAAPPKRRGLFDFILRRPAEPAAEPEIDVPAPLELASLANALHLELQRQAEARAQLSSHADRASRAFEMTLPARLARIYERTAVGARLPVRGDLLDVEAIGSTGIPPARALPTLAVLVRDLRDEAIRAFGEDDARRTYADVAQRIFGRDVASPTLIIKRAALPARGRLRRQDGSGASLELRDRTCVIGRSSSCDIVVADERVSSRHAELIPEISGIVIRDLESTNGTFVNGERLSAERLLRGGETIRVGDTTFVYERITAG